MIHKKILLLKSLPLHTEELLIRQLNRQDIDLLSKWPKYPWPHDVFRFSFSRYAVDELDRAYEARINESNRITLVVDTNKKSTIGYIALVRIDWAKRISENMSFRIHPEFCDQGIGLHVILIVREWWFGNGMNILRLDVAATNHRAVRCYLNGGFQKTGEFWREASDLAGKDFNEQKYHFLRNHVDCTTSIPKIRFYWMESKNSSRSTGIDDECTTQLIKNDKYYF